MTKKKSKPKKYNMNAAVRGALRRAFSRSPIVREVLMTGRRELPRFKKDNSLAKRPRVEYQCETCFEWVSSTKVNVDHLDPVIDPSVGFVDWNTFISRMWCEKENLKRICISCHDKKTQSEREIRKKTKANKEQ